MSQRIAQILLFFLLSAFTINLVNDFVSHHHQEASSYCCDMNEVDELNELESRLRAFEPANLALVYFQIDFLKNLLVQTNTSVCSNSVSRAFFPHALHVPIYLDKCTFLV